MPTRPSTLKHKISLWVLLAIALLPIIVNGEAVLLSTTKDRTNIHQTQDSSETDNRLFLRHQDATPDQKKRLQEERANLDPSKTMSWLKNSKLVQKLKAWYVKVNTDDFEELFAHKILPETLARAKPGDVLFRLVQKDPDVVAKYRRFRTAKLKMEGK